MKRTAAVLALLLMGGTAHADGAFSDYQMFLSTCEHHPPEDMLADCLYGFELQTFENAKDRRAHPRSLKEYRKIVGDDEDFYGVCRAAGHIKYCIKKLHELNEED